MKHIKEFSKQADSYDANSNIQKRVSTYLLSKVTSSPKKILDLGCGTGDINRKIDWKYTKFIGVDSAYGMCEKHPKSLAISVLNSNFEDKIFQKDILNKAPFDLVISSSALQWADDIEKLIKFTSLLTQNIAFAIFTCNTFKDIYNISGLEIFLPDKKELLKITKKYFNITHETKRYRLEFNDNMSMFRYIKKSGISGGERRLTVAQTKKIIKNYPLTYLEFEVLFVYTK
ncbi:MAG: methyltransferase [Sulfurospirillum sp.]|nr:methyltransferase [Sulfurospirillum sp.]MBL0703599.1 methyltransferase [Sulfurospirillum sp.]